MEICINIMETINMLNIEFWRQKWRFFTSKDLKSQFLTKTSLYWIKLYQKRNFTHLTQFSKSKFMTLSRFRILKKVASWLFSWSTIYAKTFQQKKKTVVDSKFCFLTLFQQFNAGLGWLRAYQHDYVIDNHAKPAVILRIHIAPMN